MDLVAVTKLWNIVFAVIAAAATTYASQHYVHMLQLESYQGNMYVSWAKREANRDSISLLLAGAIPVMLRICWALFYYSMPYFADILWFVADAAYIAAIVYLGFISAKVKAKKPLAYTARVKRLFAMLFVLAAVFHYNLFLNMKVSDWGSIIFSNVLRYLPGLALVYFVLAAHVIMLPLENAIRRWYFNNAKKILKARDNVIKIGITGSYGKTSTKFILGNILSELSNTLVTPDSYNTPMGITRVIREKLLPEHEIFVAEMGARYKGDITQLCELVKPRFGIITSVGKQHLDTFGSFENVVSTKMELFHALPKSGAAFINGEIPECRRMFLSCNVENNFLYGFTGDDLYLKATDIQTGPDGCSFTLVKENGESVNCKTALLGRHNILNITGASSLALYLGLTLEKIAEAIAKLEPVEHRLQLIKGPVTVIDDAFNSNPEGSKAALEVLKDFKPAKLVVVTPGMIELGSEEAALNKEFGAYMADVADIAILIGHERVEPIKKGLTENGFNEANIVKVDSLDDAVKILPGYATPGSVVLFENDLPDNYKNA